MNPAKATSWLLLGLLAVAGGAQAQERGPTSSGETAVASPPAASYKALLDKAAALLRNGKPGAAHTLLAPLEAEHAGEVRFDYLLGVAALDSGRPDTATFIFERVLTVKPDFTAARLDLARAYYQLGDYPRARTEFATVLQQNPPAAARRNIVKYLDAIDAQQKGRRTHLSGYLEGTIGHDNNINFSTSEHRVFVDLLGTSVLLDESNVQVADQYYAISAGGRVEHALSTRWGLYAGADVRQRDNTTHSRFDLLNLDAQAGIAYATRTDRMRLGIFGGRYAVGDAHHSDIAGIKGEWRHVSSPANQWHGFVQHLEYRFADIILQPNDFDQQAIGVGWQHVLPGGKSTLSASVHYGREKDVSPIITEASPDGGRNDGGKRFLGLRLAGQTAFGQTTVFASAGVQSGEYDKVNYYFQRTRSDQLYDVTLGAQWRHKRWILRPQLSYSGNDSNITIYDYDRKDVSVTLRREFR